MLKTKSVRKIYLKFNASVEGRRQYRVFKLVNTVRFNIGDWVTKAELELAMMGNIDIVIQ